MFAIQAQRAGTKHQPSPEGLGTNRRSSAGGAAPPLRLFIKWGEPWRDLQFRGPFVEMFFDRLSWVFGSPKLMKTSRRGRSKATALGFTELKPSRAQEETRVRFTSSKLSANRQYQLFLCSKAWRGEFH